jgi:hypothetical protein
MRSTEPERATETVEEPSEGESLVELVLSEHDRRARHDGEASQVSQASPAPIHGVVIGCVAGVSPSGEVLVDFAANPTGAPLPARSAASLGPSATGREAALMFEGGDARKPFIVGLIEDPAPPPAAVEAAPESPAEGEAPRPFRVEVDGERVVLEAEKEIVFRCGKASITLTRAGKVLIRGEYVLTRSAGVNRIQGGSVQIN